MKKIKKIVKIGRHKTGGRIILAAQKADLEINGEEAQVILEQLLYQMECDGSLEEPPEGDVSHQIIGKFLKAGFPTPPNYQNFAPLLDKWNPKP
jgi:hypothetical protein